MYAWYSYPLSITHYPLTLTPSLSLNPNPYPVIFVGTLAVSTEDLAVSEAIINEASFVRIIIKLLESLSEEIIHRVLIIILNILNFEEVKDELILLLCEGDFLPVLGGVIEELGRGIFIYMDVYVNVYLYIILVFDYSIYPVVLYCN
jgi:hypothetical protein